jgi:methionine aminotransferase
MSGLAAETGAINLGQGFPDFPMDEQLHEAVTKAMRDGHNQYAPMAGLLNLRIYGTALDPGTEITITPGGTYAIFTALSSFLRSGDEVIVFEPSYDSYVPNIEVNGGKAVLVPLKVPGYGIDWPAVDRVLNSRTRAIMINSPHNPTGTVLSEIDMQELSRRVENTDIMIVSDEVYEHLIFDGLKHQSVLRYPSLFERSFVCFSFGKVYNCTGWKMGYCVAPASLSLEFRKIHQFNAFSCNTPVQVGLANFLAGSTSYLSLPEMMQAKRDYFISLMRESRFSLQPSYGSYFICGTYENISDETDRSFSIRLTKQAGVATIPVSAFYQDATDNKVLRFCFSKRNDTLEQAAERLLKI